MQKKRKTASTESHGFKVFKIVLVAFFIMLISMSFWKDFCVNSELLLRARLQWQNTVIWAESKLDKLEAPNCSLMYFSPASNSFSGSLFHQSFQGSRWINNERISFHKIQTLVQKNVFLKNYNFGLSKLRNPKVIVRAPTKVALGITTRHEWNRKGQALKLWNSVWNATQKCKIFRGAKYLWHKRNWD